jgi:hypothetical protein
MMIGIPPNGAYSVAQARPSSNPGIVMTLRLLLLLVPMMAAAAHAADSTSEDKMVKTCQGELEPQLFSGGGHGESFIAAQNIEHRPDRIVIHLDLASGEGRRVSGSCVFRDGKLFDVK